MPNAITNIVTNIVTNVIFAMSFQTNSTTVRPTCFRDGFIPEGPGFVSRWVKDQSDTGLQRVPRARLSEWREIEPQRYPFQ